GSIARPAPRNAKARLPGRSMVPVALELPVGATCHPDVGPGGGGGGGGVIAVGRSTTHAIRIRLRATTHMDTRRWVSLCRKFIVSPRSSELRLRHTSELMQKRQED